MEWPVNSNGKGYNQCFSTVNILPEAQSFGNSFQGNSIFFSMVCGVDIKHVETPPIALSIPNTLNGSNWFIVVRAPMYGAVSSHILAHTMQEKTRIFRFSGSTSSAVHVNKIDWEHDTAIFGMIAVNINRPTVISGDTVMNESMKTWNY